MEEKNLKRGKILSNLMMVLAVIVILVCIPVILIHGEKFEKFLGSAGVIISPNANDGYLIAEFGDPENDLMKSIPDDTLYNEAKRALDLRKFSVKKVKFNSLSGVGIEPRLNLCFEFEGEQPNPLRFKNGFSFPVIHVYIRTPEMQSRQIMSNKTARVNFENDGFNYQVIIDGAHEQALVYDNTGKYLFSGLGLYCNYEYKRPEQERNRIIERTKITAGLPLDSLGNPEIGEWKYYVITGLLDTRFSSMLYKNDSSDVFDCILPDSNKIIKDSAGRIVLSPLKIILSQSLK